MKRLLVEQHENHLAMTPTTFWYTVRGGNYKTELMSEIYTRRSSAKRAALAFIASIDPVPVRFTYWTAKGQVTEEIR